MKTHTPAARIGIFDSGVGGLTVLRELQRQAPTVPLHYVADAAYAPYGERTADDISRRSLLLAGHLLHQGATVLVIACNTATAHAIHAVRERWPLLPVIGTEPGIKPAVAATHNGRIGVLATPATIASARYQSLLVRHAQDVQVISQPCPGLADLIETGDFDSLALRQLLARCCAPLKAAKVDTVLMGCTHYPLIQPQLQAAMGADVQLLNIETAVARQALHQWAATGVQSTVAGLTLETSGDAEALNRFIRRALGWTAVEATHLAI